eukprot:551764_1
MTNTTTNRLTEFNWVSQEEMQAFDEAFQKSFELNRHRAIFFAKAAFLCSVIVFAIVVRERGVCLRAICISVFVLLISNFLTPWIWCVLETIKHDYVSQYMNTTPPLYVYELNYNNDNMYQCNICSNPFIRSINNSQETILKCGHRFHQKCLRKFEINHMDKDPLFSKMHKCPTCNIGYDWNEKWKYKYVDIGINKMNNGTLMKYLCNDLQNTIIDFI